MIAAVVAIRYIKVFRFGQSIQVIVFEAVGLFGSPQDLPCGA